MVEYSFDRDDVIPRDDSFRDRMREEMMRDASRQERQFYDEYVRQAERENEREAIREVVNNPNITVSPELMRIINDPNTTMSPDMVVSNTRTRGSRAPFTRAGIQFPPIGSKKRTRRKTKMDKTMSICLKEANKKMRKKNGQLRKGKTMKDVMKLAHRLCKKK